MLAVITLMSVLVWAFWAVAVPAALGYLGGKLFAPDIPEADTGATPNAQSRSWNPHSTQQEGIARPRCYGKNLHHGNVVAKWTGVVNNREVLYLIVEHGDGPTEGIVEVDGVKQVFLNDQPAKNFGNVTIQERVGTMNQTVMTGFEKTKLEHELNNELLLNEPIIFTTPNDFFDDLEYTIVFPQGLRKYHKSGGADYSAVNIKVRIREHPDGGWTEIFNDWIGALSHDPLFKLYKVNTLKPGYIERGKQYDLEITNVSGPSERHVNDVRIRSVREVIDIGFERPGKALVGITAVATTQLSGSLDVKIIREDRLVWTWNGTDWEIKYSRNRAWVVFDAFTQPVIDGDGSGENPWVIDHYDGLNPSRLDLTFFYNWADFCSAQIPDGFGGDEDRIACDTILDFQTGVWTFANEIANIGRAHLYWQGHTLTGWIDKVVTETTALVTMDNIMARTWNSSWTKKNELAGKAEVFFHDSRLGYERTHAALPNEDAGKYTRIISVEGVGITTRGAAIHFANHLLKRNELIRNVNNFQQYKNAFRYKLGQVIRLQHRTPDWGASYRVIKSEADNTVELDRACDADAADLIFIQSYDEGLEKVRTDSYTVASVAGKVVTIEGTWDVTPLKNYMVAIGVDGAVKLRRIIKIDATTDNYFDIAVETYDTNLFTADDLVPNNPDQNYIWDRPANPLSRPVTRQEVIDLVNKIIPPSLDLEIPWMANIAWTGNDADTIYWTGHAASGEEDIMLFRYRGVTYEIKDGVFETTDEYVYWDPDFTTRFRTTNDAAVALAAGHWLVCTNTTGVPHSAIPMPLMHAGVLQAGTITAALGQIADLAVSTLKIQNNAVTFPVSAYTSGGWVSGDVQTLEITTTGAPLIIIASCRVKCEGTAEVLFKDYCLKLFRDANEIYTSGVLKLFVWGEGITGYTLTTVAFKETPGAGTYTYKLNLSGEGMTGAQRFLFVMETKK